MTSQALKNKLSKSLNKRKDLLFLKKSIRMLFKSSLKRSKTNLIMKRFSLIRPKTIDTIKKC